MTAPPRGPELRAIYTASVAALPRATWGGEPVITTGLLASTYGATASRIHDNHRKNEGRFVEGKHFYRLVGDDLREFKSRTGNYPVSANVRSLILWTERGAARHAKALETDAAWDVFEALEDSYFKHREATPPREDQAEVALSTVQDREPLLLAAVRMVVKHKLKFNVVYQTMNFYARSSRFAEMTVGQVAEAEQFVERFLLGQDTRQDWLRIGANKYELTGNDAQPELLGFSVPGTLGDK